MIMRITRAVSLTLVGILALAPESYADQVVVMECPTCETVADFRLRAKGVALNQQRWGNYIVINHSSKKAAEFMVSKGHYGGRVGYIPVLVDGEIDSELGARYGVVTINAKTLPPLRLPEARLSWPTTEQNYNVTQRNHVDIGTLIRQWLPLVYPVNQQLALRGKKIVVFFTDGYSGEYLIVNPLSAVCCTYVPGSLRDPNGNKVDEQLRPISRTPAASSGTTSTTIDGGRRELTIQGVAFEYNVPGSRISRRGVVHVVDLDYRTLQRYRRMP